MAASSFAQALPAQPQLTLPRGGGALRSIADTFTVSSLTGSASLAIALGISPGRAGFAPPAALGYDSGAGNGPFGLGWNYPIPSITRKTEPRLPTYADEAEADTFVLSGMDDLVPLYTQDAGKRWVREESERDGYRIRPYRPRTEAAFARIELWIERASGLAHWRVISRDNVTSIYGFTADERISDPDDPRHIFSWLLRESYDDKGNAIFYRYKRENTDGISLETLYERQRTDATIGTQRYLKSISYCNHTPRTRDEDLAQRTDWLMQVVFDYGEHSTDAPIESQPWLCRLDPFSSYRAGFEVRTYRLCQRVLVFHAFPELGNAPLLVNATTLAYRDDSRHGAPDVSVLAAIGQRGSMRQADGRMTHKDLPPTTFEYSRPVISAQTQTLGSESQQDLPQGVDQERFFWVDLYGEGMVGILSEDGGTWFYKPNQGDGTFGPLQAVTPRPSLPGLERGSVRFMDTTGDGYQRPVCLQPPLLGSYDYTPSGAWENFRPFTSQPVIDWNDPDARLLDLTGDGRPDILLLNECAITWYPSLGPAGFGPAQQVRLPLDEAQGPRLLFNDGNEVIYLADMVGDGRVDLVRIRNGEICYWPNLGYGRFGARVSMSDAPYFDSRDQFDQKRVLLADLDGSGPTDLIYLGREAIRLYFNNAGNSWSAPTEISQLPSPDNLGSVSVCDLLGNGTACLVWSSPLARDGRHPLRYIDLMGGQKPHLLTRYVNNMGKEVVLHYTASTHYYLQDKRAGTPWVTRLAFPVHCLDQVTTLDHVRQTRFTSSYSYHHGYYDGQMREFRGFGRVDQIDSEDYEHFRLSGAANVVEEDLHQPPVLTKTWFHTGVCQENARALHLYEHEYYTNPVLPEQPLPEPQAAATLNDEEWREALRACRGMPLRTEVFACDNSPQATLPYLTSRMTCELRMLQARQGEIPAVFQVMPGETVGYIYDRRPDDPRISHTLALSCNDLGQVQQFASVVYGRQKNEPGLPAVVQQAQAQHHVLYTEINYSNDCLEQDACRLRVPYEQRVFELCGLPASQGLLSAALVRQAAQDAAEIAYETLPDGNALQKRLLSHARLYFLRNDLSAPLPLGRRESLGLVSQSQQLAFTPGLARQYYEDRVDDALFLQAGYVHSEDDSNWWIPSGRARYAADAPTSFYLPTSFEDPFGNATTIAYDPYHLLPVSVSDALHNTTSVENDYRVLAPALMTDLNGNLSAVAFDELGMVVQTAVMGKAGAGEGDTLADPTTRVEYELFNYLNNGRPNVLHTFAREQHGAANQRWQESYTYYDGDGGMIMTKAQAEPGKALRWNDATSSIEEVDTTPDRRWVGNGRVIYNNKGQAVKQYQPYFSASPDFEDERALVEIGVTPLNSYDPLGRLLRVEFPDGTFSRAVFDPWQQTSFDSNDTVLESEWYSQRGSPDPNGAEPGDPESRAAWLAAQHANTPAITHSDSLGRALYSLVDNGSRGKYSTRTEYDCSGRFYHVYDAHERRITSGVLNLAGQPLFAESAEKGERRVFSDVLGNPLLTWVHKAGHDERFRSSYDSLLRPVAVFYQAASAEELLLSLTVFGEAHPQAQAHNLRGRPYQIYDQGGAATLASFDFKGNPLWIERQLTRQYQDMVDWKPLAGLNDPDALSAAAAPLLESEIFSSSFAYDALNRSTNVVLPDNTVLQPRYNEANFLASMSAQILGQGDVQTFLVRQSYDARGQRISAEYGNATLTSYQYDPLTFRLTNRITRRASESVSQSLLNQSYTYDPAGNITQASDSAQQTRYFSNSVVRPEQRYVYDALYQLVQATGREHASSGNELQPDQRDAALISTIPHPNDSQAVRTYTESYTYDDLGNVLSVQHMALNGNWTRHYHYAYQDAPDDRTNRLLSSSLPGDSPDGPYSATYSYDASGTMSQMPHLASMTWNNLDQLQKLDLGGGGTAYYVYGGGGLRIRKVIERSPGNRVERIYLGAVEIYREWQGSTLKLERRTLHIGDTTGRIAQIDIKTADASGSDPAPLNTPLIRYQYRDCLGSSVLELDEQAQILSYEEYHPFGTTSYRSRAQGSDVSLKRYRYRQKERDDESGLYYSGARYYAAWLGRWTSADPAGFVDGANLFRYARNNPLRYHDPGGTQSVPGQQGSTVKTFSAQGNPGDQETVRRLSSPDADPAEVLKFFQTHGHPELTVLPTWTTIDGKGLWYFNQPDSPGNSDGKDGGHQGAPTSGGEGPSAQQAGKPVVEANPEGFTLRVPNTYDAEKMAAYKAGVRERALGVNPLDTEAQRKAGASVKRSFEKGGPSGTGETRAQATTRLGEPVNADHTIELQHDLTGRSGLNLGDYRWQVERINKSEGASSKVLKQGLPEGVPAGGVVRAQDAGKFTETATYRGLMRGVGYGLMLAGPLLTLWGASHIDYAPVRYAGYGAAGTEGLGVGIYMYGRWMHMVTDAAGTTGRLAVMANASRVMEIGSKVMGVAGGIAQAVISGYQAYEEFSSDDYVGGAIDTLSALGGVAIVAGLLLDAPVAVTVGIALGLFALGYHLLGWLSGWW